MEISGMQSVFETTTKKTVVRPEALKKRLAETAVNQFRRRARDNTLSSLLHLAGRTAR
jgi:hypothetical protein